MTCSSPVIVIGMHRSGTTLLTKLLEASGVHWGDDTDEYNEDVRFQALDEEIFRKGHARGDDPLPVAVRLEQPRFSERIVKACRDNLGRLAGTACFPPIFPR